MKESIGHVCGGLRSMGQVPMGPEDTRVYQVPVTAQQDALIQNRNDLTDAIPFADGGSVASRLTGLGSMGYMI